MTVPTAFTDRPELEVVPDAADLYLGLMKRTLTRYAFGETRTTYIPRRGAREAIYRRLEPWLRRRGYELVVRYPFDADKRALGEDWPPEAETMVGLRRLDNLQACVSDVIAQGVPGDLIETGVWRGGSCIFMRSVLKAYADTSRTVWVADSFRGLPKPDEQYQEDTEDALWTYPFLAVSQEQVADNFRRYELLDEQVRFLPGWFCDTLPNAPIERLAVMRLDGDLYESTMDALNALYPKLSVGGYVIIDDYEAVRGCKSAVADFREQHGITDPLIPVDGTSAYWQRTS